MSSRLWSTHCNLSADYCFIMRRAISERICWLHDRNDTFYVYVQKDRIRFGLTEDDDERRRSFDHSTRRQSGQRSFELPVRRWDWKTAVSTVQRPTHVWRNVVGAEGRIAGQHQVIHQVSTRQWWFPWGIAPPIIICRFSVETTTRRWTKREECQRIVNWQNVTRWNIIPVNDCTECPWKSATRTDKIMTRDAEVWNERRYFEDCQETWDECGRSDSSKTIPFGKWIRVEDHSQVRSGRVSGHTSVRASRYKGRSRSQRTSQTADVLMICPGWDQYMKSDTVESDGKMRKDKRARVNTSTSDSFLEGYLNDDQKELWRSSIDSSRSESAAQEKQKDKSKSDTSSSTVQTAAGSDKTKFDDDIVHQVSNGSERRIRWRKADRGSYAMK